MSLMTTSTASEQFRAAIILASSGRIVAQRLEDRLQLPKLNIVAGGRTARQMQAKVEATFQVHAVVIDFLPRADRPTQCVALELISSDCDSAFADFALAPLDDLADSCLSEEERNVLHRIILGDTDGRSPLSKCGWIQEARAWIESELSGRKIRLNEDLQQLNAGGHFALIRFGTDHGQAVWLKATGAPNSHELPITTTLANLCPKFLPPLIALKPEWNAWISEEAGRPMSESFHLESVDQAVDSLAQLQMSTIENLPELISSGCSDHRASMFQRYLTGLMNYLKDAMKAQTSTKVQPLTSKRLDEIESLLRSACLALDAAAIPNTLIHNDMNASNVLVDGPHTAFADWAEGGIGNPFLTFQHLLAQTLEADPTRSWLPRLKRTYRNKWRQLLTDEQIDTAFALSPPLAIVSYLLARDPMFTSPYRQIPTVQAYARSLARYLDRFVHDSLFQEAI